MVRFFLIIPFLLVVSAGAQIYDFSVPRFDCVVVVNSDRSLDISYEIEFECTPGFHEVDIVDIGFPSDDYEIRTVEAGVDGIPAEKIYPSSYIDIGVEVHLGNGSIYSGESGVFRLTGNNSEMIFADSETDDYASVEFTPTWFDGSLLSGSTDFSLTIVFPPGSHPDSVRHHGRSFTSSQIDKQGRASYTWVERRRVDGPFQVGVSFPAHLVEGPLKDKPSPPLVSSEELQKFLVFGTVSLFIMLMIWGVTCVIRKSMKRRVSYLPPEIGVEGSGIRRGLTAPLAAMLLEEKLERVFVLILFGLLRKGALELSGSGRNAVLRKTGAGGRLRKYEKALMDVLPAPGEETKPPVEEVQKVFVDMINDLEEKMKGFSTGDTREYYRHIIRNAWEMVRRAGSAEKAGEMLADRFSWLFADEKFDERAKMLPGICSPCFPPWFGGIYRAHGHVSPGGLNISQACAQIAGTLEGAAGGMVSSLSKLSVSVTSITNPVPVTSYRSSGGSCACACACAGCACACAGGGR